MHVRMYEQLYCTSSVCLPNWNCMQDAVVNYYAELQGWSCQLLCGTPRMSCVVL
uniref:Uncharacterized protein n=1 Tax=Arundo donax TaxID=35708 RepID=A0A0A9HK25_ARUDO